MKYKVLITRSLQKEGLKKLEEVSDIIAPVKKLFFSKEEIMNYAPYLDGIIVSRAHIDADFVQKAKRLKVISKFGVGYDTVDLKAVTDAGIILTNLPSTVTDVTAELVFGIMLSLTRRIVEADHYLRNSQNDRWYQEALFMGHELKDKKIGFIGFGRVGQATAKRCIPFGMHVFYYDIEEKPDLDFKAFNIPFDKLLKEMDYIVLQAPYSEKTHHMIGKEEFEKMKNSAYFINTARGPEIDQKALIEALQKKKIAGAALDVYENEPSIPKELKLLGNVVLTPHLGTDTYETDLQMVREAADNVIQVLTGKIPEFIVNRKELGL